MHHRVSLMIGLGLITLVTTQISWCADDAAAPATVETVKVEAANAEAPKKDAEEKKRSGSG